LDPRIAQHLPASAPLEHMPRDVGLYTTLRILRATLNAMFGMSDGAKRLPTEAFEALRQPARHSNTLALYGLASYKWPAQAVQHQAPSSIHTPTQPRGACSPPIPTDLPFRKKLAARNVSNRTAASRSPHRRHSPSTPAPSCPLDIRSVLASLLAALPCGWPRHVPPGRDSRERHSRS
jgi:hypothetical protein